MDIDLDSIDDILPDTVAEAMDIDLDSIDDILPDTVAVKTVNKFQPKPRGKPKKPVAAAPSRDRGEKAVKPDAVAECTESVAVSEISTAFDMEGDPLVRPSAPVGVSEVTGALNSSSSCRAPMDFSSQVIEAQESLNVTKEPSNHEVGSQDGPQVSEREKILQTDADQPEEEAMPVLSITEILEDIFLQPSGNAVKQVSKFQPKSALQTRKQKARSVSFSLPDAAEAAAAPVRGHYDMLADHLTGAEPSSMQMLGDEFVDNIPHSTTVTSDNVDFHLDHENGRNENLADLSGLESFDGVLSEPASVTGQTETKFRPKRGARTKTAKSSSSSYSNGARDAESLEDHNLCIPTDPLTSLAEEQSEPVERSSLEFELPRGNEVLETIDATLDRDSYIGGNEKLSAISEDTGNEVQSSNDEEPTSKASEEHGAVKSSRKLRKRVAAGNPSGKLDDGIREYRNVENSNYPQMDEDCDDDEYRGEDTPKQRKQPKRSKKQMTDAQNPAKRRKKTSKEPDSTESEPPKKRFPHGTRRRRQVDKALLETPEFEIVRRQIPLSQLIRLGEANERTTSKEAEALKNNQSNNGSFSNGTNFDPDNPYDEDLDPYGEEAHRNMLRNSRKLNYQTHMAKPQRGKWSKSETEAFYEAIRVFGMQFEMIAELFPNRTRHQVKLKFKNEEKRHPKFLNDAICHPSKDLSLLEKLIQQRKAKEEEESRLDDGDADPTTSNEGRDQPEKQEQEADGFDGEAANSEKSDERDEDNEYESVDWDVGTSSHQDEEKHAKYGEFVE